MAANFYSNINGSFFVTTTGSIGIGSWSTSDTLGYDLNIKNNNAQISLESTNASGATYLLTSGASDNFVITKSGVGDRLTISSGGNVTINSGAYFSWGTAGSASIEGSTVSNKLQFRTNSTDAMIIDSSQNVGIGTTAVTSPGFWYDATNKYLAISHWATPPTPAAILHISDDANDIDVPQIRIEGRENPGDTKLDISVKDAQIRFNLIENTPDANAGYGLMIFKTNAVANASSPARGGFNFQTPAVTSSLFISNEANVGIGTDTPDELLHLYKASGNTGLEIEAVSGGDPIIRFVSANNRTGDIFYTDATTLAKFSYDHSAQAFKTYAHNNTTVDFYLSETEAYFPSQDVGIGTTSPTQKLHIYDGAGGGSAPDSRTKLLIEDNGEAYLGFNVPAASYQGIRFAQAGVVKALAEYYGTANSLHIGTVDATGTLEFHTTNSVKMIILANGNVGIGNTDPSRPLDITSDSGGVALKLRARTGNDYSFMQFFNNAGTTMWSEIYTSGTASTVTALHFSVGTSTTERMRITSSGTIYNPNTQGSTWFGLDAGLSQVGTTGSYNTLYGYYAGRLITTGARNTIIGGLAGDAAGTNVLNYNVIIGSYAGGTLANTSNSNVIVGDGAGASSVGMNGNVIIGQGAGDGNTGASNVLIGYNAALLNTSGQRNVAIGYEAGKSITSDSDNIFIGYRSGYLRTAGTYNTFVGSNTNYAGGTGSYNTGVGRAAGYSLATGDNNTLFGKHAGYSITDADNNTIVGFDAGLSTTGAQNTLLGSGAGDALTTGSHNNIFGYACDASSVSGTDQIVIGTNGQVGKGNSTGFISPGIGGVYQGNNSTTWSNTSDERIKKNIVDNNKGLEFIDKIQIRNFEYRTEAEIIDFENPKSAVVNKDGIQLGVIAQEIEKILPEVVTEESTGVKAINADNLIWYLINAVKELKAEIDILKTKPCNCNNCNCSK